MPISGSHIALDQLENEATHNARCADGNIRVISYSFSFSFFFSGTLPMIIDVDI
jgi:hypothetical protein